MSLLPGKIDGTAVDPGTSCQDIIFQVNEGNHLLPWLDLFDLLYENLTFPAFKQRTD